jgi:3D (Asp-Asp-Asp) domain-containing protein
MKKILLPIIAAILLNACQLFEQEIDLDKIQNPDEVIFEMYPDFQLERMYVEDLNYDEFLDYEIIGYDKFDNYIEAYFIHNGEDSDTYTYMTGDDYWNDYEGYSEYYENVEEYFEGMEDVSSVEEIFYQDVNSDGIEDALVVSHYTSDDYYSIDVYIFVGSDEGFEYFGLGEMYYPSSEEEFGVFKTIAFEEEYFTIELLESGKWERYITFKYDAYENDFLLHQDGGKVWNEQGELEIDELLTEDDFGYKYFYEFMPDDSDVFSLRLGYWVNNTTQLLEALGSNRIIHIQQGDYVLNDLNALPAEARSNFNSTTDWSTFYSTDAYTYQGWGPGNKSEIALTLVNLRNTTFIGEGDVRFIVDNELVSVLRIENCAKLDFENIYMVHDVGGYCGANVLDMFYSDEIEFEYCVFDGSGEIGVLAEACYSAYFTNSDFTNCTNGAIDFSDSDAIFDYCNFNNNSIYSSLVGAYGYSSLDFYDCSFTNNEANAREISEETYLFYADDDAYIYLDSYSIIENNSVDKQLNDRNNVTLP